MAKVRVYELAKELGVESKVVLAKLQDMGEFVRSASSTVEAPVVRRLKEVFPAAELQAAKPAKKSAAKKATAKKTAKKASSPEGGATPAEDAAEGFVAAPSSAGVTPEAVPAAPAAPTAPSEGSTGSTVNPAAAEAPAPAAAAQRPRQRPRRQPRRQPRQVPAQGTIRSPVGRRRRLVRQVHDRATIRSRARTPGSRGQRPGPAVSVPIQA